MLEALKVILELSGSLNMESQTLVAIAKWYFISEALKSFFLMLFGFSAVYAMYRFSKWMGTGSR